MSRRLAGANAVELDDRALLPHLTLGRVKMAGAGVDWPKILQAVEVKHVTSVVDRVTLYRSQLSQQGPHYTGLVSAPLIKSRDMIPAILIGYAVGSLPIGYLVAQSVPAGSICAASAAATSAPPTCIAPRDCRRRSR